MIEPPIMSKNLHNIFQYIFNPLPNWTTFLSLEMQIGRLQMFFKHQKQRYKEENMRIEGKKLQYFAQNLWGKNSRPFKISNPIIFSFLISFEQYKNLWLHQLRIYKQKLYSKRNGITTKEFSLEIQNCNMLTIEHEPHYMNNSYVIDSLINLSVFCGIGNAKRKAINVPWML